MSDEIEIIRIYGDPVLRKMAEKVTDFDNNLHEFADRMIQVMYEKNGIGLAGPQVGISHKIVTIDLSFGEEVDNILTLINLEILNKEGEVTFEEGCLSVPGIYEELMRSEKIFARYQDIDGEVQEIEADAMLARVIQHEVDHLEGILFVDRLSTVKRNLLAKKLRSITKDSENY